MTLTEIQKDYLKKRNDLDSSTRSRCDFKLVQKLKSVLDNVQDAYWILRFLPRYGVRNITDDQIFPLLEVSTMLMRRMDYKKLRSIDDKTLFVYGVDEEGRLKDIPPSEIDLQRAKKLYEHLYELERFIDIRLFERVKIPGYERPAHFPGGLEDVSEHQQRDRFQEAKAKKEEPPGA